MLNGKPKRDEGVALILSLMFLIAMAILVAAMADRSGSESNQVQAYVEFQNALQGAESALALARAELAGKAGVNEEEKDGLIGVAVDFNLAGPLPTFGMAEVNPVSMELLPGIEYFAVSYDWSNDGIDNNGDGNTDDASENDYFTIRASARGIGGTTRSTETILQAGNIGVWNNALFGGEGQTPDLIRGHLTIHGSVHLRGGGLLPGDFAICIGGGGTIYNNYSGMDADLKSRVPALDTIEVAGETVETLQAQLRVKTGMVQMTGSSQIGYEQATGNGVKETIKGIYVNDGWLGNLDADGDPTDVWSDNGFSESYDLGDIDVPFPTYSDDQGKDHLAYFLETDADPVVGFQNVHVGDITIKADVNYYWDATTGIEVANEIPGMNGMPTAGALDPSHYYLWLDAANNRMIINGRIAVDGDIFFLPGAAVKNIDYFGKAALLAYDADDSGNGGDVSIETDLRSANADGSIVGSFPGNSLLGVMAQGDMRIAATLELDIMGGFYAERMIHFNEHTDIVGTMVSNYFNLHSAKPNIYQVPVLADSWTEDMRMIGSDPIRVFSPISWRELGVRL